MKNGIKLNSRIYKVCINMAQLIQSYFKIEIPDEEILFIYQYLISSGVEFPSLKFGNKNLIFNENIVSKNIAKEMIKLFSDILGLDLNIDKKLYEDLVMHLRPMLNRIKYKIDIKNELIDYIKKELPTTFALLSLVMLIIRKKFDLKYISEDEIGYLAVYFQAALEQSMNRKRVIIVCSSGIGTSHLLKNRIKHSFPDWDIVDVVSVSYLDRGVDLDNIDFIISTVKIRKTYKKPIVYVTVLFNDADVKSVTEVLINDSLNTNFNNKFEIIKKYLKIEYINIVDKLSFNRSESAYILFKNIIGDKNIKYSDFKTSMMKISMDSCFEVYVDSRRFNDISRIGINIVKNKNGKDLIQIVILYKGNYNIMTKLITEIFQLFNNKILLYKIHECATKNQVINLFNNIN